MVSGKGGCKDIPVPFGISLLDRRSLHSSLKVLRRRSAGGLLVSYCYLGHHLRQKEMQRWMLSIYSQLELFLWAHVRCRSAGLRLRDDVDLLILEIILKFLRSGACTVRGLRTVQLFHWIGHRYKGSTWWLYACGNSSSFESWTGDDCAEFALWYRLVLRTSYVERQEPKESGERGWYFRRCEKVYTDWCWWSVGSLFLVFLHQAREMMKRIVRCRWRQCKTIATVVCLMHKCRGDSPKQQK